VVGSRRFKLAGGSFRGVVLDPLALSVCVSVWLFVFKLFKLRPILVASNMSNPAAGTMTSSIQYLRSSFRSNLLLPSFLRFRRARIRIRPSSSDSSSDKEIETLLLWLWLWNIMEDETSQGCERERGKLKRETRFNDLRIAHDLLASCLCQTQFNMRFTLSSCVVLLRCGSIGTSLMRTIFFI